MPVDTEVTREHILEMLSLNFDSPATWGVVGDWFEQHDLGPFVAIQEGVYRQSLVGVFSRLDNALRAALQAIVDEPDRYHSVLILAAKMDEPVPAATRNTTSLSGPTYFKEDKVASLAWRRSAELTILPGPELKQFRGGVGADRSGRVVCLVKGLA